MSKFSNVPIPEDIRNIAEKARFSDSRINHKNLDIVLQFAESRKKQLMSDVSSVKQLYFRYILVLA